MSFKLLTENRLEFPSLTEGYTGSSESTLVKLPHCWKSRHGSNSCENFQILQIYSIIDGFHC